MILLFLFFWLVSAIMIALEKKIVRLIIHLGIFSLTSSVCFLLLAAPDVAMAEAVTSIISTIIFIVCFEKYFSIAYTSGPEVKPTGIKGFIENPNPLLPIGFTILLAVLFIAFIPDVTQSTYLKEQYLTYFSYDVGGENSVTAIYLGYRVYDTLFEALLLLVGIVAVMHLSFYEGNLATKEKLVSRDINSSTIAITTVRSICPVILMFSVYLVINGHITAGGGFQGGLLAAAFFICRYIIFDIYDINIDRVVTIEKLTFVLATLAAAYFIFFGARYYLPIPQGVYLIMMNTLIGLKVASGFLILFYRFIVYERR